MSEQPQYTHRDRIKFACFSHALEQGLNEEQMIDLFTKAAEMVRSTEKADLEKTALFEWVGPAAGVAGAAALAPFAVAAGGNLGYMGGQVVRRTGEGYIPSPDEVHLADEAADYKRAVEEIRQRVHLNRLRELQRQAPSNRRMF